MLTDLETTFKNYTLRWGLGFLLLSSIIFGVTINVYSIDHDIYTGVFFLNYGLTAIYFIMAINANKEEFGKYFRFKNFARNIILLQLFNISAYSLNRSISVFNISPNWVVCFLLVSNCLLLLIALFKTFKSTWLNHLMVVIATMGMLFHLYESIFVMQIYPFAVIGFWFFGIPLHIFVPVLLLFAFIKVVRNFLATDSRYWTTILVTISSCLLFIGYFSFRFHQVNKTINNTFHQTNKPHQENSLPEWLLISQQLKKDWITERALKSGFTFSDHNSLFSSFNPRFMNERKKHDPLVVIASFFSDGINIQTKNRIKILQSLFDNRHSTERKLWSGKNLSTTDIVTNVQLFPQYHLAYTEKTFRIKNSKVNHSSSTQEALYTFYLPESSVVTSASLWVNGEERPAYLTTKSKANNAYTKIVGVERRDPLLLHWKEGNRVTVRVFPCSPNEDRQFKIGVTTPLRKTDNRLTYENIDFEGPYWKDATESINVVSEGPMNNIKTPLSFYEDGLNYQYKGRYDSRWSIQFDAPELSGKPFSFNGRNFKMVSLEEKLEHFNPEHIYLDINAGWSNSELRNIWKTVLGKQVFVHSNHRMTRVTEENKDKLFKQQRHQHFTLFPFYKIDSTQSHLVISKYNQLTPTLEDIKQSVFMKEISSYFNSTLKPTKVLNIGTEISPYLLTLKELRNIQLECVSEEKLTSLLSNSKFNKWVENEQTIVNQYAGFQLEETNNSATTSQAPDHLMRLFVYNDLLRKLGKNYFNKTELSDELISEAKEAYVVTPISSLIVLETQKDYDRFDIKKSKNSLQNASIGNSGAVPEPGEWLLIILVLLMTIFLYFKR